MEKTVALARDLKSRGNEVVIVVLSNFQPKGQLSELEIYTQTLRKLDPELDVRAYRETNDTLGQVEKSFELKEEMGAQLIFTITWMHYLRVIYLAHGRPAKYFGAFGLPHPAFIIIDPVCLLFQPLTDALGLKNFFQRLIVRQREKGKILF